MKPGQQIREYCLTRRLGVGGVGEVWEARHVKLDQVCAFKIVHRQHLLSSSFRDRFQRVAEAQARLDHPNIIKIRDFFVEQELACLVMQYVEGESLRDRIDEAAPLALDEVTSIARDTLLALDYAHQQRVFHRDVKPSNILLDKKGKAYLSDFDTALIMDAERKTQVGATLGTAYYMSPEQIKSPGSVDQRADVYSMGCVLFEMLAARPPFEASEEDSEFALMKKHIEEPPPSLRSLNRRVDPAVDAIVARALAKDPANRYGGCHEFAQALEERKAPPVPKRGIKLLVGTLIPSFLAGLLAIILVVASLSNGGGDGALAAWVVLCFVNGGLGLWVLLGRAKFVQWRLAARLAVCIFNWLLLLTPFGLIALVTAAILTSLGS